VAMSAIWYEIFGSCLLAVATLSGASA
jgi:hypothetical protein